MLNNDLIASTTVTEPTAHVAAAPTPLAPGSLVEFPMTWLLDHASNAIRYRAITDVGRLGGEIAREASVLTYAYAPALALAVAQSPDGIWNGAMLEVPSGRPDHFERVGTISAFRRLLEYGWERDTPPLMRARRLRSRSSPGPMPARRTAWTRRYAGERPS